MPWKRLLAYITGTVDEEILLRNEYFAAENRILRGQLKGRLRLTDGERRTLAEIGKRLGRQALGRSRPSSRRRPFSLGTADS
jgi:putative transposase